MDRKSKLELSLKKAAALHSLYSSREYQEYLEPYLKELSYPQIIDFEGCKDEAEYLFKLKESNNIARIYKGLLSFLRSQEAMMNKISEELKKPPISHGI